MPGPAPKAAHLHVLSGNPSNKKIRTKTAPKSESRKPAPPRSLAGDSIATYKWRKVVSELTDDHGKLPTPVLDLIETYCATYSTWRAIRARVHKLLKEFGALTVKAKSGYPMEIPDATQERKYAAQLKMLSAEISRQLALMPADAEEEEDELEKRMARRRSG